MPPLPTVSGKKLRSILEGEGFVEVRSRGSHHFLRHPDGRRVCVPVHGNRDVRAGTLRNILRTIDMTVDELIKHL